MSDNPTTPAVTEDMEKRTQQFIDVRDALKRLDDEYKEKRKPLLKIQELLSGRMQAFMSANNLENLRTKAGTCYTSVRRTASLADPAAFMNFVIETNQFELLDRRANSTAVQDFVKKNKVLPPGCNLSSIETLGVRRGNGEKDDE